MKSFFLSQPMVSLIQICLDVENMVLITMAFFLSRLVLYVFCRKKYMASIIPMIFFLYVFKSFKEVVTKEWQLLKLMNLYQRRKFCASYHPANLVIFFSSFWNNGNFFDVQNEWHALILQQIPCSINEFKFFLCYWICQGRIGRLRG